MAAKLEDERLKALQVLELDSDATEDDIKQAYRQKALQTHPDKNQDDSEATQKFQEVGKAYATLTKGTNSEFEETESDVFDLDEEEEAYDLFFRNLQEYVFIIGMNEDDEFVIFYNHLHKKRTQRGSKDVLITQEELRKFHSYDEWMKARDPKKRHNKRVRKAKKKANKVSLEKPQVIPKKQLQADQYRREREAEEIRQMIESKKDEEERKMQQEKAEAKRKSEDAFIYDPKKSRLNCSENVSTEPPGAKSKTSSHKKKSSNQGQQGNVSKQSKSVQPNACNKPTGKGVTAVKHQNAAEVPFNGHRHFVGQVSKEERQAKLDEFKKQVKEKKAHQMPAKATQGLQVKTSDNLEESQERNEERLEMKAKKQESLGLKQKSQLLAYHLEQYREMIKVQPKRHTEEQLRQERDQRYREQQQSQMTELTRLREKQKEELSYVNIQNGSRRNFSKADEDSRGNNKNRKEKGGWRKLDLPESSTPPKPGPSGKALTSDPSKPGSKFIPAPAPVVNKWAVRQEQKHAVTSLMPASATEEQRMLQQALELSRLTIIEEERRKMEIIKRQTPSPSTSPRNHPETLLTKERDPNLPDLLQTKSLSFPNNRNSVNTHLPDPANASRVTGDKQTSDNSFSDGGSQQIDSNESEDCSDEEESSNDLKQHFARDTSTYPDVLMNDQTHRKLGLSTTTPVSRSSESQITQLPTTYPSDKGNRSLPKDSIFPSAHAVDSNIKVGLGAIPKLGHSNQHTDFRQSRQSEDWDEEIAHSQNLTIEDCDKQAWRTDENRVVDPWGGGSQLVDAIKEGNVWCDDVGKRPVDTGRQQHEGSMLFQDDPAIVNICRDMKDMSVMQQGRSPPSVLKMQTNVTDQNEMKKIQPDMKTQVDDMRVNDTLNSELSKLPASLIKELSDVRVTGPPRCSFDQPPVISHATEMSCSKSVSPVPDIRKYFEATADTFLEDEVVDNSQDLLFQQEINNNIAQNSVPSEPAGFNSSDAQSVQTEREFELPPPKLLPEFKLPSGTANNLPTRPPTDEELKRAKMATRLPEQKEIFQGQIPPMAPHLSTPSMADNLTGQQTPLSIGQVPPIVPKMSTGQAPAMSQEEVDRFFHQQQEALLKETQKFMSHAGTLPNLSQSFPLLAPSFGLPGMPPQASLLQNEGMLNPVAQQPFSLLSYQAMLASLHHPALMAGLPMMPNVYQSHVPQPMAAPIFQFSQQQRNLQQETQPEQTGHQGAMVDNQQHNAPQMTSDVVIEIYESEDEEKRSPEKSNERKTLRVEAKPQAAAQNSMPPSPQNQVNHGIVMATEDQDACPETSTRILHRKVRTWTNSARKTKRMEQLDGSNVNPRINAEKENVNRFSNQNMSVNGLAERTQSCSNQNVFQSVNASIQLNSSNKTVSDCVNGRQQDANDARCSPQGSHLSNNESDIGHGEPCSKPGVVPSSEMVQRMKGLPQGESAGRGRGRGRGVRRKEQTNPPDLVGTSSTHADPEPDNESVCGKFGRNCWYGDRCTHGHSQAKANVYYKKQKVVPPRFARLPQNSKNIGKSNLENDDEIKKEENRSF